MGHAKIESDFQKRYGAECERIYFLGKPLTFFRGNGGIMGCNVSAGCYFVMEKRNDDRIMVQFSHSDKFITVNSAELEKNDDEKMFKLLLNLKKSGVVVGGARILFYRNSRLESADEDALLLVADSFCKNIPQHKELIRHAPDYDECRLASSGKANYISCIIDGECSYFPYNKDIYKIVISSIPEKNPKSLITRSSLIRPAQEALRAGDYKAFGRLLNMETEEVIEHNRLKLTKKLYELAKKQKEALGSGVIKEGGIFSLIESREVDYFIGRISMEYRKFYGSAPEFYVVDTETTGWIK